LSEKKNAIADNVTETSEHPRQFNGAVRWVGEPEALRAGIEEINAVRNIRQTYA